MVSHHVKAITRVRPFLSLEQVKRMSEAYKLISLSILSPFVDIS